MNKGKIIVFIFTLFLSASIFAQDAFHYTHFDMTQVALNPALAGGFEGTARIGGLLREQDYGLEFGQFATPVLYVDAPLIRGLRKQDWIGFGFAFQYDEQKFSYDDNGNILHNKLVTTNSFGGLSYHFALDKKRKNVIAIGVQSGSSNASFPNQTLVTPESIKNSIDNPGTPISKEYTNELPFNKKKKSNKLGYTIGTVFTSKMSKTKKLRLGLSVSSIGNRLNYSVLEKSSGGYYQRKLRFAAFSIYQMELPNGLVLEPRLFFQFTQPSWEGSAQILAGVKLKKPKPMVLYGGLGYNPINGAQFLLRADLEKIRFFYSFDLNLTDKQAVSGAASAMEFGASYILKIKKRPNPDPVLICPNI